MLSKKYPCRKSQSRSDVCSRGPPQLILGHVPLLKLYFHKAEQLIAFKYICGLQTAGDEYH